MNKHCALILAVAGSALSAVSAPMLTPWGEKITSDNAWRNYPRPQMVRSNWTCLNGEWDYAITKIVDSAERPTKWDGKIRVPFALESILSGVRKPTENQRFLEPEEYLWYTKKLNLDPKENERILLHFGAVDFRAIVFLGHDEVAFHEGGQLPFTVDLTKYAKKGENTLTVLVWDPTEKHFQSRGKQCFRSHGCFYTRSSGIWQTVWLENVPKKYISDYNVVTDVDKSEVVLTFAVDGLEYADNKLGSIKIESIENSIDSSAAKSLSVSSEFTPGKPVAVKLPAPVALWSPESPSLYHFTAKFGDDEVKGYFAMRKFEKRRDAKGTLRFYLNNKPYYIMGTLDQGWWPDGLLTPPSEEAIAFDIKTLKDCGFNTMRKHIKVEPLAYYALCDKLGLIVLQDMPSPNGDAYSPFKWETVKGYSLYRDELKGMINLLKKVPSILVWVPYNEGWGQHDLFLTHATFDFVKAADPTRLVNGPSGWQDNEGGELLRGKRIKTEHRPEGVCEAADIVDYHYYRGPAMPPVNNRRVSFLGEFGGVAHFVNDHIWRDFDQAKFLGEKKGGNWGYGGVKDSSTREALENVYMGLMGKLGEYAVSGLAGSIYTQTTDVELELNGLLTYDRKVLKFDASKLKKIHEDIIRRAYESAVNSK